MKNAKFLITVLFALLSSAALSAQDFATKHYIAQEYMVRLLN